MSEWTGRRRSNIAYGTLSNTRKLLRRLPDDLTGPVREAFKQGAEKILQEAKFNVLAQGLVDSGDLHDALEVKFGRDGLSAKVGLVSKRARKKGWYGRFHEFGTKGGTVKKPWGNAKRSPVTIPPLPARPFLGPAFDANREEVVGLVQKAITRALNKAAGVSVGPSTMSGSIGLDDE